MNSALTKRMSCPLCYFAAIAWMAAVGVSCSPKAADLGASQKDNSAKSSLDILNVSYDPTRELYKEYNQAFVAYWKEKSGQTVTVNQSHGGAGAQARKVIEGLEAHVVTLALAYDIDAIGQKAGVIAEGWSKRLPHNSCPYTSTIVFLVRQGNPKGIKDWDDLIKPEVKVITPHPKTSGGARWNYLAAWGYVLKKELGDFSKLADRSPEGVARVQKAEKKALEFVTALIKNVPMFEAGARGATNAFAQRGAGDVLLAWENEALLQLNEIGKGKFEIVVPTVSILAEPPVTVVDKWVDKYGTRQVAEEYLKYLYSPVGQEIVAKHYYRPHLPEVAEKFKDTFLKVELFTIDEAFGGWQAAQKKHFNDGGVFDQIQKAIQ